MTIRGFMPHLPAHEVLSPTATWITTTVRTAHKAQDPHARGLRDKTAGQRIQNNVVLVVVDGLTKMAHFTPCRTAITAEQTAKLFNSKVVRLHGILKAIMTPDLRYVQLLDKNMGTVWYTSPTVHDLPPTDRRSDTCAS
ncbi:hypothetical protein CLOM_g21461 [Closterium sp. NIES-68]|nr:hypothetical protein CLOM_g21461 [Closterium sp. NIES-68]